MCGLVALCTRKDNGFTSEEFEMFEHSMIFNQLRGDDSTGGVAISNKDKWVYLKNVGGYKALSRHVFFDDFKKEILNHGRLVFGHGRAATRGNVTVENAHPFLIQDKDAGTGVIFVHNGTLDTYQPGLEGMYKYSVDSEFLANAIHVHGAEKALSEVEGAVACMWWDIETSTFNFYHNKDRPLFYMVGKNGAFYLNSERWILEYLNWKFKLGAGEKKIYGVAEMKWHSIAVNDEKHGSEYKITDIKKPKRTHYHSETTPARWQYEYYKNMYGYTDDDDPVVVTRPAVTAIPPENKKFWDRDIELIEWVNGDKITTYRDKRITREQNVEPPKKDLIRMYELRHTGNRMCVYNDEGKDSTPIYVEETMKDWERKEDSIRLTKLLDEADKECEKEDAPETDLRSVPRIKDKIIRFNTKHPVTKAKVKHRGIILKNATEPFLEEYMNSIDGHTSVGKKVNLELLYAEDRDVVINGKKGSIVRVVCCEVKPKQDTYIDYEFYSTDKTKQEIEEIKFFSGVVGGLKLSSIAEQKKSGACCIGSVHSVKYVESTTDNIGYEAANETVH